MRGGYGIFYAPLFEAIAFVGRVLDGHADFAGVCAVHRLAAVWYHRDVGAGVGTVRKTTES